MTSIPEKAKALLAEAGYPDGFETTIQCIAVDPQPKLCESFQQDLANVGIKLNVETLAAPNVIDSAGNGKNALTWSGGLAWTQDYPDPDDFYAPILGCDSNVPGGWNWSRYCNEELHAKFIEQLLGDRSGGTHGSLQAALQGAHGRCRVGARDRGPVQRGPRRATPRVRRC